MVKLNSPARTQEMALRRMNYNDRCRQVPVFGRYMLVGKGKHDSRGKSKYIPARVFKNIAPTTVEGS